MKKAVIFILWRCSELVFVLLVPSSSGGNHLQDLPQHTLVMNWCEFEKASQQPVSIFCITDLTDAAISNAGHAALAVFPRHAIKLSEQKRSLERSFGVRIV